MKDEGAGNVHLGWKRGSVLAGWAGARLWRAFMLRQVRYGKVGAQALLTVREPSIGDAESKIRPSCWRDGDWKQICRGSKPVTVGMW